MISGRYAGLVALLGVTSLGIALQERRGGPVGVFKSEVPEHDLTVIQSGSTEDSVVLSVMSPTSRTVEIETPGRPSATKLELSGNEPQNVTITGLSGQTSPLYKVKYGDREIEGTLSLRKKPGNDFDFAIQADSHLDENTLPSVYMQTLINISKANPDFLVDLGDTFMTGKHQSFEAALPMYRAQRYYFGLVGESAPIFMVLGNHDGEQGWVERNQSQMTTWSRMQRTLHFPPPAVKKTLGYSGNVESGNYYATTWGDALIVVLDPFSFTKVKPARNGDNWGWTLGEEQYRWFAKALSESKAKYKFVFIHHLVGGSGKDTRGGAEASPFYEWGGSNLDGSAGFAEHRPGWSHSLHDLCVTHGVDVVFRGHDHLYVRQDRDGVIYQLVPQPGHARGSVNSAKDYGYVSGTILPSSGFLKVSVKANQATVSYLKTNISNGSSTVADEYHVKP